MNVWKVFSNGIIKENPVLVMLLGTCPALATTALASTGLGMGIAATFVLICSNIVISLIKNIIPKEVRLPCFIVVIAGFVTLVSFLLQTYVPGLYAQLGIFLPLIVVNCIILGRAEMFASKNSIFASSIDGVGMGIGFTLALVVIGTIREVLGMGSFFGIEIPFISQPMMFFATPAGGFFVYGFVIAMVNVLLRIRARKPKAQIGCGGSCASDGSGCGGCKSVEGSAI